jgi:hypothetical protein
MSCRFAHRPQATPGYRSRRGCREAWRSGRRRESRRAPRARNVRVATGAKVLAATLGGLDVSTLGPVGGVGRLANCPRVAIAHKAVATIEPTTSVHVSLDIRRGGYSRRVSISVRTRKRLWARSGGICAYPGCDQELLVPTGAAAEDTIVAKECHIVAQEDDPKKVARSVSALTPGEREEFKDLVENRDDFANLILMCGVHSDVIDDPRGGITVAQVIEMKRDHEGAMDALRSQAQRRADELALRYAAIIDEWQERLDLDEWPNYMSGVMSGHPTMKMERFDRLTALREWLFARLWPGTEPNLEDAFENFRRVLQDFQRVFGENPDPFFSDRRDELALHKFYRDAFGPNANHNFLMTKFEYYVDLIEDLAVELTRAINAVCEAIRQTIDPQFRIEEGMVLLVSGMYSDLSIHTHRLTYPAGSGSACYPGLESFLSARTTRDLYFGSGRPPEGVYLLGQIGHESSDGTD